MHLLTTLLTVSFALEVPVTSRAPRFPYPQHVTYAAGTLLPGHRSRAQLDNDVRWAYRRWKARYLVQAGTEADGHPRYRVKVGSADSEATVSEGQGYGMVLVAYMAGEDPEAQVVFDGLWEFSRDHPSEVDPRLMDWYVAADEEPEPEGNDSAFDGDCDIAFALLLADAQWGSDGRVDYRSRALEVIDGVHDSTIGPDSRLPMLGDWVEPDGEPYNQHTTRTSDLMPAHFRAFVRTTGDVSWEEVIVAGQTLVGAVQTDHSPVTGLLPDFVVPGPRPAPPDFLEGPYDGDYYYNAGRVPWRLGVDAVVWGDPTSTAQVLAISQWVRVATAGDPDRVGAGYRLDGTPIGSYFTSYFVAPMGVAAMVDPAGHTWLDAVYEAVRGRREGYFEDSVTLLAMLVMTHNWWDPTLAEEQRRRPRMPANRVGPHP